MGKSSSYEMSNIFLSAISQSSQVSDSALWDFVVLFMSKKKIPPAIVDLLFRVAQQWLSLLFLHFPVLSYVTRHSSLAGVNLLSQEVNLDARGKGCTNIHSS